uniref:ZAD domain-containing protein n=1 Tax=Heliothis virescens TaxID=7102 RepID=A0A2A4JKF9_HELVI
MASSSRKGPIVDPGLCRCCGALKKCRILNVEYEWLGQKEVYSDMFVDCFGLLLSHLEGAECERLICATCVVRLRDARAFRRQVLQCEEKLLNANIQVHEDGELKNEADVKVEIECTPTDEAAPDVNDMHVDLDDGEHQGDDVNSIKSESPKPVKKSPKKKKTKTNSKTTKRKKNINGESKQKISKRQTRQNVQEFIEPIYPPQETPKKHIDIEQKSFANTIVVVENSYVSITTVYTADKSLPTPINSENTL